MIYLSCKELITPRFSQKEVKMKLKRWIYPLLNALIFYAGYTLVTLLFVTFSDNIVLLILFVLCLQAFTIIPPILIFNYSAKYLRGNKFALFFVTFQALLFSLPLVAISILEGNPFGLIFAIPTFIIAFIVGFIASRNPKIIQSPEEYEQQFKGVSMEDE